MSGVFLHAGAPLSRTFRSRPPFPGQEKRGVDFYVCRECPVSIIETHKGTVSLLILYQLDVSYNPKRRPRPRSFRIDPNLRPHQIPKDPNQIPKSPNQIAKDPNQIPKDFKRVREDPNQNCRTCIADDIA